MAVQALTMAHQSSKPRTGDILSPVGRIPTGLAIAMSGWLRSLLDQSHSTGECEIGEKPVLLLETRTLMRQLYP